MDFDQRTTARSLQGLTSNITGRQGDKSAEHARQEQDRLELKEPGLTHQETKARQFKHRVEREQSDREMDEQRMDINHDCSFSEEV